PPRVGEVCGRAAGAPRPVGRAAERRNGDLVRGLITEGTATAVHDVSDGGLMVALAEMAMASGIGARLYAAPIMVQAHAFWFGEDQARYAITVRPGDAEPAIARAKAAGVPVRRIGWTAGNALTLPGEGPILVKALSDRSEGWLPAYMAGGIS